MGGRGEKLGSLAFSYLFVMYSMEKSKKHKTNVTFLGQGNLQLQLVLAMHAEVSIVTEITNQRKKER